MARFLKSAYQYLPGPTKTLGAQVDYLLARRIRAYHHPSLHLADRLARGSVTISLDFELAWGWQYSLQEPMDFVAKGLHERNQVPKLVRLFDEYETPTTWATVGHLFLERCTRWSDGLAHRDMPRLMPFRAADWRFTSGDYFQFDPCTDVQRDPAWYAPDLIGLILASRLKHEIGCHGFSHVGFGPFCPPEVAAAEIQACVQVMAPYGLSPTTMVFPRHSEGNFEALAAHGVRIVRSFPLAWPNLSLPVRRSDGMWGVHVSSALDRGEKWTSAQRLARLQKFVDGAVETGLNAHIWLHPSLSDVQINEALVPFLRYCGSLRDRGVLDILTVQELVDRTRIACGSNGKGAFEAKAY
jgi:hypothetical protein